MSEQQNPPPFKAEGQLSSGQLLQAAREARKLTYADVASKLRLSEQYVKDLEADDFTHIGARTYVRGYLLSYAKLLGIQQEEMLAAMQASLLPDENMSMNRMLEREKPVINISLRPRGHYKRHLSRLFGVVIFVALVIMVVFWWQSQNKPGVSNQMDKVEHLSATTSTQDTQLNTNNSKNIDATQTVPLTTAGAGGQNSSTSVQPTPQANTPLVTPPVNNTSSVTPAPGNNIPSPSKLGVSPPGSSSAASSYNQTSTVDIGNVNDTPASNSSQQTGALQITSPQATTDPQVGQNQSATIQNNSTTAQPSKHTRTRHHLRHSRAQLPAPGST